MLLKVSVLDSEYASRVAPLWFTDRFRKSQMVWSEVWSVVLRYITLLLPGVPA